MKKIIISQSFIKAMNHGQELDELEGRDRPQCPARAQAIYIDGMESRASEAMSYGNFMETLLWGATGNGEVTTLKRKAGGLEKRVVQKRLEHQAWMFKNRWMPEMNMTVLENHPAAIKVKLGERYVFRARLDMYASFQDDETFHPKVIGDLKVTADVNSSFGPFSWGAPHLMDHIQAIAYTWAHAQKFQEWLPFYYFVLSYNKINEWKLVRVMMDATKLSEFKTSMRRTADLIDNYNTAGKWPKVPSAENCARCPIKDRCERYRVGGQTVRVY